MPSLAVKTSLVNPIYLDRLWPSIVFLVNKALKKGLGEYDANSIRDGIKSGTFGLFVAADDETKIHAIAWVRIACYPLKKVCVVSGCAGVGMENWLDTLETVIEPWAKQRGCNELRLYGREGWVHALKEQGWSRLQAVVGKSI